ncbi:hypothetical protein ABTC31_20235, partial [Acinetobacter baumannii]
GRHRTDGAASAVGAGAGSGPAQPDRALAACQPDRVEGGARQEVGPAACRGCAAGAGAGEPHRRGLSAVGDRAAGQLPERRRR